MDLKLKVDPRLVVLSALRDVFSRVLAVPLRDRADPTREKRLIEVEDAVRVKESVLKDEPDVFGEEILAWVPRVLKFLKLSYDQN